MFVSFRHFYGTMSKLIVDPPDQIFYIWEEYPRLRAAATAYGAPSFPCSYFIDQYSIPPPSQIAPSPLMLHNLGLSGCF